MQYLLLVVLAVLFSSQNVFQKQYNIKAKRQNVFLFSAVISFAAMIFFVISSGFKLQFTTGILVYSIGFALMYASATIGQVLAIKYGSLAITSLLMSYSLIIPTSYGIVFLKEPIGINVYIGIVLLLISLLFLNAKGEKVKFSWKWIVFMTLGFVGNGMCSTVQKMQQLKFDGVYKSEFMIIALAVSVAVMLIAAFRVGGVKESFKDCIKYAMPCGIANGGVNLLVMVLTAVIPNAILFPTISASGIVISFIVATMIYKEKLTKLQMMGYITGIVSVIILNL